jgi:hypothetical protein
MAIERCRWGMYVAPAWPSGDTVRRKTRLDAASPVRVVRLMGASEFAASTSPAVRRGVWAGGSPADRGGAGTQAGCGGRR